MLNRILGMTNSPMLEETFENLDNSAAAIDLIQPSDIAAAAMYLLDSENATQELHVGAGVP